MALLLATVDTPAIIAETFPRFSDHCRNAHPLKLTDHAGHGCYDRSAAPELGEWAMLVEYCVRNDDYSDSGDHEDC